MTEPNVLPTLKLVILTPEAILFEEPVDWAEIPLVDGWIGIGPEHAPLIAALGQGAVRFAQGGENREILVSGGILRIDREGCAVLTGGLGEERGASQEALAERLEDALYETLSVEEIEALQEQ